MSENSQMCEDFPTLVKEIQGFFLTDECEILWQILHFLPYLPQVLVVNFSW